MAEGDRVVGSEVGDSELSNSLSNKSRGIPHRAHLKGRTWQQKALVDRQQTMWARWAIGVGVLCHLARACNEMWCERSSKLLSL